MPTLEDSSAQNLSNNADDPVWLQKIVLVAIVAGLMQSFLIYGHLSKPMPIVWLTYIALAVVSMLVTGVVARLVVLRSVREDIVSEDNDEVGDQRSPAARTAASGLRGTGRHAL